MPEADATYREGGAYAEFAAAVRGSGLRGRIAGGELEGEVGGIVGRRLGRDGRVTWYDRVDSESLGRLGALFGALEARAANTGSLEVTLDHGRPLELRLRAAARWHGDTELPHAAATVRDIAASLRGAPASPGGRGRRIEAEISLDLTDPANRRALAGVVDVWRLRAPPSDWDDRLRALAARLDADGDVDVRVEERDLGAEAALGLSVGGGYRRTQEVRELLRAWSLHAGAGLREREDCLTA
jgi:hypothetical protein